MVNFERRINALGGTPVEGATKYDEGYADGHSEALTEAMEIGADADGVIEELMETLDEMLHPGTYFQLIDWAKNAEILLTRIRGRLA